MYRILILYKMYTILKSNSEVTATVAADDQYTIIKQQCQYVSKGGNSAGNEQWQMRNNVMHIDTCC